MPVMFSGWFVLPFALAPSPTPRIAILSFDGALIRYRYVLRIPFKLIEAPSQQSFRVAMFGGLALLAGYRSLHQQF